MQNMAALVCNQPGQLELIQVAKPTVKEGEVLLAVRRIGICGTDFHIFEGKHPFLKYPRIMGHELSAEVVEAPGSSTYRPGDIVVINPYNACGTCKACRAGRPNCCATLSVLGVHEDGGMCEFLSLPEKQLLPANGLSVDACATVEFLAIGAHAVRRASSLPGGITGKTALVVGAGPIGLGAAVFATLAGAEVTLADRDAGRLEQVAAITKPVATLVFGDNPKAQVAEATGNAYFDVVFDATGNARAMEAAFDFAGHGGTHVMVGVVTDPLTFSDADFHRRELTLMATRNAINDDFQTVIRALKDKRIDLDKVLTHRSDLGRAIKDLPHWSANKGGLVKALLEVA